MTKINNFEYYCEENISFLYSSGTRNIENSLVIAPKFQKIKVVLSGALPNFLFKNTEIIQLELSTIFIETLSLNYNIPENYIIINKIIEENQITLIFRLKIQAYCFATEINQNKTILSLEEI